MKLATLTVWMALGLCPLAASAQISMGRPGFTPIPPVKKTAPPAATTNSTTLTPDEQRRLAAVINHMPAKDRKRFAKAVKKMTPQQKQQLIARLKLQLSKTAAHK